MLQGKVSALVSDQLNKQPFVRDVCNLFALITSINCAEFVNYKVLDLVMWLLRKSPAFFKMTLLSLSPC